MFIQGMQTERGRQRSSSCCLCLWLLHKYKNVVIFPYIFPNLLYIFSSIDSSERLLHGFCSWFLFYVIIVTRTSAWSIDTNRIIAVKASRIQGGACPGQGKEIKKQTEYYCQVFVCQMSLFCFQNLIPLFYTVTNQLCLFHLMSMLFAWWGIVNICLSNLIIKMFNVFYVFSVLQLYLETQNLPVNQQLVLLINPPVNLRPRHCHSWVGN